MMSPRRLQLIYSLVVLAFPTHSLCLADSRPNILLIVADDLGAGDLHCCGASDLRTPHLDGLAARGARFTQFYANSSVCSPTRASLMTGRYPEMVGVPGVIRTDPLDSWGYLAPNTILLPMQLRTLGYQTALIGKWHLGLSHADHPNARGFDLFHGFLGDMMDDYLSHRRHGINYLRHNQESIEPVGHASDLFSRWACDYLESQRPSTSPFFLYLAFNAPHAPIQPPRPWLERVQGRYPQLSPRRANLVAMIEHLDDCIGRVLQQLQDSGLASNTFIIFSSDNGGQLDLGAHNGATRGGKGSMYEGGLRVPTIMVWPERIPAGHLDERPAMTADLFPTICAAADMNHADKNHEQLPQSSVVDGCSLLPVGVRLPPKSPSSSISDRHLFFIRREGGPEFGGQAIYAVRKGPWKLVQPHSRHDYELYHLARDPFESNNLSGDPEPETQRMKRELLLALQKQIQRSGSVPWQPAETKGK